MLKTKDITIDEIEFSITQFPGRKSIKLDKKTVTILAPMVSIFTNGKKKENRETVKEKKKNKENESNFLDMDIDFETIGKSIQNILMNLTDKEFMEYVVDMVANTTTKFQAEGVKKVQTLSDPDVFDLIFAGNNLTLYKLLIEIMNFNSFSFFALMGGGGPNKTNMFG